MHPLIERALAAPGSLTAEDLEQLLSHPDYEELRAAAYGVKCRLVGKVVSLRGLIELGNVCGKDCLYCGIRRSNRAVERYRLGEEDAVRLARWCLEQEYGSVVIQSGEVQSEENTAFIERIVRRIHGGAGERLGITLCLGEQTEETYRRWREAGAHRYLLRIETSDPSLYAAIHPSDHSYAVRLGCLRTLKALGYQTGSGVMTGLPGQTLGQLARDICLFRELDLDMIGMGPFIPHRDTPLGRGLELTSEYASRQLQLGLRMIAVTRLALPDVNIAATTALQALDDQGREQGLLAGANVIMPNVTDTQFRRNYQLYEHKPCLDENSAQCRNCLTWRVLGIGEKINWGQRGDSPHATRNH